jgi:putative membrane protein
MKDTEKKKRIRGIALSETDRLKIKEAVAEAEKSTSGEIATALIRESSDYALHELLFALAGGVLFYFICLPFYGQISLWLEGLFWDFKPIYVTLFLGIGVTTITGILYLLANIPGFDRLIVPKAVMAQKVNQRALRHFMEAGLFDTRDRTGILIFISFNEKRVEILADRGINEKVDQAYWNDILSDLVAGIKEGRLADSLSVAVEKCGTRLTEFFPIKDDDTNELTDGLVILED